MTSSNIVSGFEVTGIVPYNPDRIPKETYLPSSLYCESSQAVTEVVISAPQESMQSGT